jgi:hypothetical protein
VARGLGCAPESPFWCLASSSPPSIRPTRAKSPPPPGSRATPFYTEALGSAPRGAGRVVFGCKAPAVGGLGGLAQEKGNLLPPYSVVKTMAYKGQHRHLLSYSPLAPMRYQLEFGCGVRRAPVRDRRASSPFSRSGSAPTRRRTSLPRWDSGRCGSSSSVPAVT